MQKVRFNINHIPAVMWGEKSSHVIIAVHGNMSNKEDVPIEMLAKQAVKKGYQILSFDLPEHGERKKEGTPCKAKECVNDLAMVMDYAKDNCKSISLFANSMGAYFSLLAYKNEDIERAYFLSPVVDMLKIIENMMKWFQVSEQQLEKEQTIETPAGQKLYWDDYNYVKEHPVDHWNIPTFILYGDKDNMCDLNTVSKFADQFKGELTVVKDAEHYFHTEEQLSELNAWLGRVL